MRNAIDLDIQDCYIPMKYSLSMLLLLTAHLLYAGSKERNPAYTLSQIDAAGMMDKSYERDVNTFINSILHYPSLFEGKPSRVLYESDSFVYFGHKETYTAGDLKTDYIRKVNRQELQTVFPIYNQLSYQDIKLAVAAYIAANQTTYNNMVDDHYRQLRRGPDYAIGNGYLLLYMPYNYDGSMNPSPKLRFYMDLKTRTIVKAERLPQPYPIDFLKENVEVMPVKHQSVTAYFNQFLVYPCSKKEGGCLENLFVKGEYVYYGYPFVREGKQSAYYVYRANAAELKAVVPGYLDLTYNTIDDLTKPCWDTVARHYDELRKKAGLSYINYDTKYYPIKYDGEYIVEEREFKLKDNFLTFLTVSRYHYIVYIDKTSLHIVHTSRTIK